MFVRKDVSSRNYLFLEQINRTFSCELELYREFCTAFLIIVDLKQVYYKLVTFVQVGCDFTFLQTSSDTLRYKTTFQMFGDWGKCCLIPAFGFRRPKTFNT